MDVENAPGDGQWPWEAGGMPVDRRKPAAAPGSNDYVLPKVKAGPGEDADRNGLRPVTVRELAARAKERRRRARGAFAW